MYQTVTFSWWSFVLCSSASGTKSVCVPPLEAQNQLAINSANCEISNDQKPDRQAPAVATNAQ